MKRNRTPSRSIFDNEKDRGSFKNRIIKKRNPEKEFTLVEEHVLSSEPTSFGHYVYAETVALDLQMEVHRVKQCFHQLNLAGKLSKGINESANDMHMRNDPYGDDVCQWHPTKYKVLSQ